MILRCLIADADSIKKRVASERKELTEDAVAKYHEAFLKKMKDLPGILCIAPCIYSCTNDNGYRSRKDGEVDSAW